MQPPKTETKLSVQYISQAILSRFTPIRYLTPEVLAMQLDNFQIGWIAMAALSWEAIERRDDTLKGVAAKRRKNVAKLKRESLTRDTSEEAKAHAEALDEFYDNMTCVNALDENERGGFSLLVRQMMDSAGKYYAVHEIVWQPGDVLTAELRFAPLWFFENRTGRLRFLRPTNRSPLQALGQSASLLPRLLPGPARCRCRSYSRESRPCPSHKAVRYSSQPLRSEIQRRLLSHLPGLGCLW